MLYLPPQHIAAVERAAAALAAQFPQHIPGQQDGWLILTRTGRPVVVWDLKEKIDADTPEQEAKRLELAAALAAAGLAVTLPGHMYMVFFAEVPADPTGPRYTVAHDGSTLGGLFGGPHQVMDTFTGVHVATADTPEQADQHCADFTRAQHHADAQRAAGDTAPGTVTFVPAREADADEPERPALTSMVPMELPGLENPDLRWAVVRPGQRSPKQGDHQLYDLYWCGNRTWASISATHIPLTFGSCNALNAALQQQCGTTTLADIAPQARLTRIPAATADEPGTGFRLAELAQPEAMVRAAGPQPAAPE